MASLGFMIVNRKKTYKQISPNELLSDAQVMVLASKVKSQNQQQRTELFRHLGEIHAARVGTMAMGLGAPVSDIIAAMQEAKS